MNSEQFSPIIAKRITTMIRKFVKTAGKTLVVSIQEQIAMKGIYASGDLFKSIKSNITEMGTDENTVPDFKVHVYSDSLYANFVNKGTKPHFPPVSAIERWIVKKNLVLDNIDRKSLAFLIARSISGKGTPETKFFELGIKRAMPKINSALKEVYASN